VWNPAPPDTMYWYDAGEWQLMLQRPSLAIDRQTEYLYCSVWRYDTLQVSASGWPSAEAYVNMSRNCGRSWSEAVNVTRTIATPPRGTPAGSCLSNRDITVADYVDHASDGHAYLDMEYIMDLDAGSFPRGEGVATLDSVFFQRIPIDSIPATPIHNPSYPALHVDSTDFPGRMYPFDPNDISPCFLAISNPHDGFRPESFKLYQNFPNPFNPTTNIQFDLVRDARVSLKIYNVLGQEVATLFNNQWMAAGVQTASFDASHLASGVYIYRLNAAGHVQSLKMVVLK